jgi:hypothetical protein
MNQPFHIGLNAQLLSLSQSYQGAGISWYQVNLLRNLARVSLRLHRQLTEAAQAWDRHQRDDSYLFQGGRLAASLDGSVDIYVADPGTSLEIAQSQVWRELTCQERVQFLYEDLDCADEDTPTPEP